MNDISRVSWLAIAVCALFVRDLPARAESPEWSVEATDHNVAQADQCILLGKLELVRPARVSEGLFALRDGRGAIEAYLSPAESVELESFVGQQVAATVSVPNRRTAGVQILEVQHVTSLEYVPAPTPGYAAHGRGSVILAAYDESIAVDGDELVGRNLAYCDDSCCDPCCESCCEPQCRQRVVCGPDYCLWAEAQYLLWWTDGMAIPPLVTSSPAGTPRAEAGVLGQPGTRILLGNQELLEDPRSGLRVRLGGWLDEEHRLGLQGEILRLEEESENFVFSSNSSGSPILARPFFNVNPRDPFTLDFDPPAREDSQLVSYPAVLSGSVSVGASTRLESAGLVLRQNLLCESCRKHPATHYSRVDLMAGYRYLQMKDHLQITENLASLDPLNPAAFSIFDRFNTRNEFNGADLGMIWEGAWQRWSLDFLAKAAVGNTHQVVDIQGQTIVLAPGVAPETFAGGLLAQQSNIGHYSRDRFAVVPEIGVTLGFQVLRHWRVTGGYTLIYWSTVARAGDQIDLDVNPDQLPPPIDPLAGDLRPAFAFQETSYWAQGISLGLQGSW